MVSKFRRCFNAARFGGRSNLTIAFVAHLILTSRVIRVYFTRLSKDASTLECETRCAGEFLRRTSELHWQGAVARNRYVSGTLNVKAT